MRSSSQLRWAFGRVRQFPGLGLAIVLLLGVSVVVNLLRVDYMRRLIAAALSRSPMTTGQVLVLSAVVAAGVTTTYLASFLRAKLSSRLSRGLREDLVRSIHRASFGALKSVSTAGLFSIHNESVPKVNGFISDGFTDLVFKPLMALAAAAYMFSISPLLLGITVSLVPLMLVLLNASSKVSGQRQQFRVERVSELFHLIKNAVESIEVIQAYNAEGKCLSRVSETAGGVRQAEVAVSRLDTWAFILILAVGYIPQLTCLGFGAHLMTRGVIGIPELLAFVLLIDYITNPACEFFSAIRSFRNAGGLLDGYLTATGMPPERSTGSAVADLRSDAVECNAVSFRYGEDGWALKDASFQVAKTETVAIVGASGAGKSTLLEMACGLLSPGKGAFRVFGSSVAHCDLDDLRRRVAFLPQDSQLFALTIAENIRIGRAGASDAEIVAAATGAGIHDFICELPLGYETVMEELSQTVSGGERQRIALARAILKDAPLLVVDEPTASLDPDSGRIVLESLHRLKGRQAILIATHLESAVSIADRVLVIEDGTIVQSGAPGTMSRDEGPWARVFGPLQQDEESGVRRE